MRMELQIRELEEAQYHFYGPGADLLLPRMGSIWEAKCKARVSLPPSLGPGPGHGNLRPEDFAMTGQLDIQILLPLLAPLTPVDIR